MESVRDLVQFLEPTSRVDVKSVAVGNILALTGSPESVETLAKVPEVLDALAGLVASDDSDVIRKDSALALINFSADPAVAAKMAARAGKIAVPLWKVVADETAPESADPACMTLCNLTSEKLACDSIFTSLEESGVAMETIVDVLCRQVVPPAGDNTTKKARRVANLHYMGPLVSNLSQLPRVRAALLADEGRLLARVMSFTDYEGSLVRRGGAVGTIRNCCFDVDNHGLLLHQQDVLTRLLLPLAGPTPDDMDEEDVEKMPVDLQYLGKEKQVEEDSDVRKLLLEALLQLCATRRSREHLRDKNAYLVLRELHKAEQDPAVKLACENVVDILIKKESEIQLDNYRDVDVPDHIRDAS